MKKNFLSIMISIIIAGFSGAVWAGTVIDIPEKERCKVCGMFVAKYAQWITATESKDGEKAMFDGVKDMMAYYFEPEKYGGKGPFLDIHVRDYYTQKWVDGRKAYYVTGSDVMGPMGTEFIPFQSKDAAQNFKNDHHGKMIFSFDEITLEMVNALRSGMKNKMMHKMKDAN